jgi:hypothetical protein
VSENSRRLRAMMMMSSNRPPLRLLLSDRAWNNSKSSALEIARTVRDDRHFERCAALVAFAEPSRYAMVVLQATAAGLADVYSQMLRIDISVRDVDSRIIGVAAKSDLLAKWLLRVEFMYHPAMLVAWAIHPKYALVSTSVSVVVILRWMRKIMQPIDEISFEKVKKGFMEYKAMVRRQDPEIWTDADVADGAKWHQDFTGHAAGGFFSGFSATLLSLPASAAAGEGNWSTQGLVVNERRTNLNDRRATKLVGVKWNLKAMERQAAPRMHKGMTHEKFMASSEAIEPHSDWEHPGFGNGCFHTKMRDADGLGFTEDEILAATDGVEDDEESEESEEDNDESRYYPYAVKEGFYVANAPRCVSRQEISVGDEVAAYFYAPYYAWFEGLVKRVGRINSRRPEENLTVEFDDGLAFLALTTETYGENESWVLLRKTEEDDEEEEEDRRPRQTPTKQTKRRRRGRVVEEEDDDDDDIGRVNL